MSAQNKFEVECVSTDGSIFLTAGRQYQAEDCGDGWYYVKNNEGHRFKYLSDRFRPVPPREIGVGDTVELSDYPPWHDAASCGAHRNGQRHTVEKIGQGYDDRRGSKVAAVSLRDGTWHPLTHCKLIRPAAEQAREAAKSVAVADKSTAASVGGDAVTRGPQTVGGAAPDSPPPILPETVRLMRPVDKAQYLARQERRREEEAAAAERETNLLKMLSAEDHFAVSRRKGFAPAEKTRAAYRAMCEGGAE